MNPQFEDLKRRAFEMTEWENLDYDVILERFGELIIQECANLFPLTFTDEQYQRRIDKTIRKHFGVEE